MSNISELDSYIATLNIIQENIVRYGYLILFVTGNIGCILNILVLTQRNYRRNSCSTYILASTFTNIIMINTIVFLRFLNGFNIDPTKTSVFFCKFRLYMAQSTTTLSRGYILLACIDRWALTSRNIRRRAFARMKIAKILIPSSIIIWFLMALHIPFYHDIIKGQCISISKDYSMFYNLNIIIISGIIIPISMIIFSFLCLRNVKRLQQRVHAHARIPNNPNLHQNVVNKKAYDYQLFSMIFVQQCVYIITNFPFVLYLFYSTITLNWAKSNIHTSLNNLCMAIVYVILHGNFTSTFYIYILTSSTFRKDLKRLLCYNRLMNRNLRISR